MNLDTIFLLEDILQHYNGTYGYHKVTDVGMVDSYMVFLEKAWT